ncbi:hypothetical protein V2K62_03920 [Pseudomonas alliivorans]|uniref:hypothetical protein n=1 Tax=Pseudomonas alliivorans TaxID=2810613 RepID=UPI0016120D0A|nr:hypothetical protein [Pseudomonas alliivorans]MEE4686132.1 hypothetical protein [Pseudomonas alliivorans]MEE4707902.1 hypothetical protein [Pseudomonas alliivorans]MEE4740131.1 hypothetical protein [Pseudomonas alliivorans]MEE4779220.1 hypothetical protein [Pseudomonas alliivorans]
MKELMTAVTEQKRDAKHSLTNDIASKVKQIFRLIVRELRPEAPRRRLLERCRKRREED